MTRIKCWKKKGKELFKNKNKDSIAVSKVPVDWISGKGLITKWEVAIMPYKKLNKFKEFNKKSQALKFANKYMKSHDKC